jgi:ring-1,2-phenylacetyl-CoA epoxidase subunit PaaA
MSGARDTGDADGALVERVERGEVIEQPAEMTDAYREQLVHLMTMQADSELAGAFGYVPWIMKAPSTSEMLAVAQIAKDEVRHARVMYTLLKELGLDVEARVQSFNFALRVDEEDIGTARPGEDARVNIFYYPIRTWADFIMFNVLMDRGAGFQLQDVEHSSYGPWRRAMQGIMKEETMHIAHGDAWLKRWGQDERHHDEVQEALDRWYPRVMNIFGRPNSPRNAVYRRYGLKRRDNDEVRRAFAAEVAEVCKVAGLEPPPWKPDWERVPDDAWIAG